MSLPLEDVVQPVGIDLPASEDQRRPELFVQQLEQYIRIKNVDTHGGAREIGMTHERIGVLGLFRELDHAVGFIGGQDAEFVGAIEIERDLPPSWAGVDPTRR